MQLQARKARCSFAAILDHVQHASASNSRCVKSSTVYKLKKVCPDWQLQGKLSHQHVTSEQGISFKFAPSTALRSFFDTCLLFISQDLQAAQQIA